MLMKTYIFSYACKNHLHFHGLYLDKHFWKNTNCQKPGKQTYCVLQMQCISRYRKAIGKSGGGVAASMLGQKLLHKLGERPAAWETLMEMMRSARLQTPCGNVQLYTICIPIGCTLSTAGLVFTGLSQKMWILNSVSQVIRR